MIIECAEDHGPSPMAAALRSSHSGYTGLMHAKYMGCPLNRKRRPSTFVNNSSVVMVENPKEFVAQVGRDPVMPLSGLFVASKDQEREEFVWVKGWIKNLSIDQEQVQSNLILQAIYRLLMS